MKAVSVHEIEQDFHSYLQLVQAGETVIITEEDVPIAEMVPVLAVLDSPRPYGLCSGEFVVPEDFDAPLL